MQNICAKLTRNKGIQLEENGKKYYLKYVAIFNVSMLDKFKGLFFIVWKKVVETYIGE